MFVWDLVAAFVIAMVLASLFYAGSGRRTEGAAYAFWFVFVIVFLFAWAGGAWLTPFGPAIYSFHWAPFFVVGLFVLLLLATLPNANRYRYSRETAAEESAAATTALGVLFWMLIAFLLIGIVMAYR